MRSFDVFEVRLRSTDRQSRLSFGDLFATSAQGSDWSRQLIVVPSSPAEGT